MAVTVAGAGGRANGVTERSLLLALSIVSVTARTTYAYVVAPARPAPGSTQVVAVSGTAPFSGAEKSKKPLIARR